MSVLKELEALGFKPDLPWQASITGDFELQDDCDGNGVYIRQWYSSSPCPFPELLRRPVDAEGYS
jgi:hypothetical protein